MYGLALRKSKVYTDDTILLGPDKKEIEEVFKKLDATFNIEDQGELSDY